VNRPVPPSHSPAPGHLASCHRWLPTQG